MDNELGDAEFVGYERSRIFMSALEQKELKQAIKEALKEAMVENSEMLKELLAEVLEDMALLRRMEEGRQTELISREDVMEMLEPKH